MNTIRVKGLMVVLCNHILKIKYAYIYIYIYTYVYMYIYVNFFDISI